MDTFFVFNGIVSKDTPAEKIQSLIPIKIAEQQSQFKNNTGDNDPANIVILEFAYMQAEPNCWFVFAKWKVK
jgi:hypothetical protein